MVSAVILAAGRALRMGEQKLFLPLNDKPVLQWVLQSALAANLHELVCVVRDLKPVRERIVLTDDRLHWLVNYGADGGQSTSVIAGLWAIDPRSEGALFMVGDQPLINKDLIDSLIDEFQSSSALIVAPAFQGQARNPVLFRRELFPELLQLKGDRGGRALIEKHRQEAVLVEWRDEIPFMDLDVREDYERLKELA
jgi:molybdenum cofactor cytidylyltransferase